jgi:hypothetical protein
MSGKGDTYLFETEGDMMIIDELLCDVIKETGGDPPLAPEAYRQALDAKKDLYEIRLTSQNWMDVANKAEKKLDELEKLGKYPADHHILNNDRLYKLLSETLGIYKENMLVHGQTEDVAKANAIQEAFDALDAGWA